MTTELKTSTHTPGPWRVTNVSEQPIWVETADTADASGFSVALAMSGGGDSAMEQANARLIAAAPELSAALSAFVAFVNYVVNKRGSCVTEKHLVLDDEDVALAKEMLADAGRLLAKVEGR